MRYWNRRARFGTYIAALAAPLMLFPAFTPQAVAGSTAQDAATKCGDFGAAVAVSGSVAVVGAYGADSDHGATCVFTETKGAWHQQAVWDGFSSSLAVSSTRAGTYVMVGSGGSSGVAASGIVYVYARSGSTWHREETLDNPNRKVGEAFGSSIAMSGTTAVISDDGYRNGSGVAYVYVKSGSSWRLAATLSNPAPAANALFGGDVSLSGSTIIVGDGIQPSPAARPFNGKAIRASTVYAQAYVFTGSGSKWHVQARLTDTSASPAMSAAAVAVYGNVALLGAENGGGGQGETYLFTRTGTTWRRTVILRDPTKDYSNFGTSVALAEGIAVIGAPYGRSCGVTYVYERSGEKWQPRLELVPPKCPKNTIALFGWAVAVSGQTALVGAGYGGAYVIHI